MDRIVPLSVSARSQTRAESQLQAELADTSSVALSLETVASAIVAATRDSVLLLDGHGIVLDANAHAHKLSSRGLIGHHLLDLVQIPTAPFRSDTVMQSVDHAMLGVTAGEEGGASRAVEVFIIPLHDHGQNFFAAQIRDIQSHSELDKDLHRLAYFDPLTQLPNRYAMLNQLTERLNAHESFTLWHLNIDRFRVLKNSLGHNFGDRVLVAISERLRMLVKDHGMVSRLANDEFVLILPRATFGDIDKMCHHIQAALTRNLIIDGRDIHLKASLGIVESSELYMDPAKMLSDAEIATYHAKMAGGGIYVMFDQSMRDIVVNLQRTEADLRNAVKDDNQLWVAYQPIVDLKKGTLAGFEALVRWEHPQYGQIAPSDFIPIAETTGLIIPLGRDVLAQACHDVQRWTAQVGVDRMPFMSVNLSLMQLAEGDFLGEARELLKATGINPKKLKLEITESTLMTDPEQAITKLQEIRNMGINLSIDDFGTGYSSLAYLHRLPVNTLKIDKSFVSRIDDPNDREIVRIITELAGILNLDVIAEGVETIAHVEALQSIGCDYGQGFFFGKGLDAADAERLIVDAHHWPIA